MYSAIEFFYSPGSRCDGKCGQTIGFVVSDVRIQIRLWDLATWAEVSGARFSHHKLPPGVESVRQTLKLFGRLGFQNVHCQIKVRCFGNILHRCERTTELHFMAVLTNC